MATFEKRGEFWRVKVRRRGAPTQTRTFNSKSLAQQWARTVESEIDNGVVVDRRAAERTSLAQVLERYRLEVTSGMPKERFRRCPMSHPRVT